MVVTSDSPQSDKDKQLKALKAQAQKVIFDIFSSIFIQMSENYKMSHFLGPDILFNNKSNYLLKNVLTFLAWSSKR